MTSFKNAAEMRHPHHGMIVKNVRRPSAADVEAIASTYTAFALDRLGKLGAMVRELKPVKAGMKCCGPAVTSLGPDLSVRRMAINLAQPGDVLVVAAGGGTDYACFGDGTANRMRLKGLAGAVIDGATRDASGLIDLGFPTFVRGITPRNYHYPVSAEYGAVNVPVTCAGQHVEPGDVIFGDDDGVIVIPFSMVAPLAERIRDERRDEIAQRAAMTAFEPFDVADELTGRGYRMLDSI
ncbi:MAG TPA: RraA family protein [Saliniramus sp.]|nr:RraA family protein [Saliniramus sp.]